MRLLALDFDGVIADTSCEGFVVALRTFVAREPGSRLDAVRARLDTAAPDLASAIAESREYGDFMALMPLGNRAEDFGVALKAIAEGVRIPDQRAYDSFRDELGSVWLESFHERFYETRRDFMRRDPEGWRRLQHPYQPFVHLLRRRAGEVPMAIATAKDRAAVRALLTDFGIGDLVPDRRLLDKETGVSKAAHLRYLHASEGAPFNEITFVDDKVNHLLRVEPLGVRCALAAWGYNGRREQDEARGKGILVCSLDDVEETLFASSPPAPMVEESRGPEPT